MSLRNQIMIKGASELSFHDVYDRFRVVPTDGCLSALLAPPPMKSYIENSSRLEAGKHLSGTPCVDSREVTLTFYIIATSKEIFLGKLKSLYTFLNSGEICIKLTGVNDDVYHLFYLKSNTYDVNAKMTAGKIAIKFIEPDPTNRV